VARHAVSWFCVLEDLVYCYRTAFLIDLNEAKNEINVTERSYGFGVW
jgi:hypothetical protein